jgi:hypothetical protein
MEAELKTCTYDTARLRIIGLGEKKFVPVYYIFATDFRLFDSSQLSPTAIKESFAQLIAGWMETIPQLAQGSDGWPKPETLHVCLAWDFFPGLYSGIIIILI